jgi:hypothetical protein
MRRTHQKIVLALGAAVVIGGVVAATQLGAGSPSTAAPTSPARAEATASTASTNPAERPRAPASDPILPALTPEWKAELAAKVKGDPHPGEAAFVLYCDKFVDDNMELAEQQAKAQGVTIAEMRALTRLGLLAMTVGRHVEIEEVIGHELSADAKKALEKMTFDLNSDFKKGLKELVEANAPEADRWELISKADADFRAQLFKLAGLNAAMLDDMLSDNLLLPTSPPGPDGVAANEEPQATPAGTRDTVIAKSRPAQEPTAPTEQ